MEMWSLRYNNGSQPPLMNKRRNMKSLMAHTGELEQGSGSTSRVMVSGPVWLDVTNYTAVNKAFIVKYEYEAAGANQPIWAQSLCFAWTNVAVEKKKSQFGHKMDFEQTERDGQS